MPCIRYEDHNFRPETLTIIDQAIAICEEWKAQGFDLTLRQLYYQFVARDLIPNNQRSYDRLGKIVNDARMAGLLDWDYIVDRTRNLRALAHWNDPTDILEGVAEQYRNDKWANQKVRIEAWIEKDALVGILQSACRPMDVPYFSCRGYTSQSEVWGAAQRLRGYIEEGKDVVILHLGDHDPSGVDMTRDVRERLNLFIATDLFQGNGNLPPMSRREALSIVRKHLIIERVSLNMDQVEQYNPPPNPAKYTDARYAKYVEMYGRHCWELDALSPNVLVDLIQNRIKFYRDDDRWEADLAKEKKDKERLKKVSQRWPDVAKLMAFMDKREKAA